MNNTALLMLGQRIQHYRRLANLTQEQLAELTNLNVTTVSKIETGILCPRLEVFINIAKAIHATPNQLLPNLTSDPEISREEYLLNEINQLPYYARIELLKSVLSNLDK